MKSRMRIGLFRLMMGQEEVKKGDEEKLNEEKEENRKLAGPIGDQDRQENRHRQEKSQKPLEKAQKEKPCDIRHPFHSEKSEYRHLLCLILLKGDDNQGEEEHGKGERDKSHDIKERPEDIEIRLILGIEVLPGDKSRHMGQRRAAADKGAIVAGKNVHSRIYDDDKGNLIDPGVSIGGKQIFGQARGESTSDRIALPISFKEIETDDILTDIAVGPIQDFPRSIDGIVGDCHIGPCRKEDTKSFGDDSLCPIAGIESLIVPNLTAYVRSLSPFFFS